MGWLTNLISGGVVETAKGVADVVDKFVETEDEKTAFKTVMARMAQQPGLAQVELNKIGAAHRSIFVAGWRPAVGWVCAVGLAFAFLVNPILQWTVGKPGPELPLDIMMELVIGMLGLAGLRTAEKLTGRAK
jgi:hypothetical protein